jgi:tetratricopeptide (TPR) repeat protein
MKSTRRVWLFVLLLLTACAFGQRNTGGGETRGVSSPTVGMPQPSRGIAPGNPTSSVFISGKVTLDDGTDLAEPAAIQTICRGQRHTMTYTDRRGSFSFQFGDPNPSGSADMSDASSSMMTARASLQQSRDWQDCEVQAVLAGFSSDPVELTSRMSTLESTDVGRVVLHRLEHVDGTSISVTSILAPNTAKKALEKGREDEKKGKWDQAQQSFEKAVQIYPKYAAAWSELGQAQMHHNDAASAKHSFEQSVAADPKYVNPYEGLARMAFDANQWPDVLETTNKLLALNPVNFPDAYFFNGVANFHLKNLDAAEKSARQGLRVDDGHQFPKMEYLLGMILLQKADYPGATEHMTQYLHLATQPADVAVANNELAEIARLSAKPNSAAVTDKK